MKFDAAGWCSEAAHHPSPNCDDRPEGVLPELLVIHSISLPPGDYGGPGVTELFTNRLNWSAHPYYEQIRGLKVSAHFFIRRDGRLVQFVGCARRAWHAGVSSFEGRSACNDFSIGVELEGLDTTPFEAAQYRSLVRLGRALTAHYRLAAAAAHSEIAPGRKTDPGPGFDWDQFLGPERVALRRVRGVR